MEKIYRKRNLVFFNRKKMKLSAEEKTSIHNIEEWLDVMKEKVENGSKLFLISGASSSGKSYISERLESELKTEGKRVILLSTDNFYKGLSATIVGKAQLNHFEEKIENLPEIIKIVREITVNQPFNDKFSSENMRKMADRFKSLFHSPEKLVKALEYEFNHINFDEPYAVDLKACGEFLTRLVKNPNEKHIIPDYSMVTSEVEYPEKNAIYGKDYDIILIEGIYGLNSELLDAVTVPAVKSFINSDSNSLLVRRLDRDIKKGRSSMSKETVISKYLTHVFTGYIKYTYPDISKADFVLENTYTKSESETMPISIQEKYIVTSDISDRLKKFEWLKTSRQTDYFLRKTNANGIIRIRAEDGEIVELTHKYEKEKYEDKLLRSTERFSLRGELSEELKNPVNFTSIFKNANYSIDVEVSKARSIYAMGDVTFRVDNVDNLGTFVEFTSGDEQTVTSIKKSLGLTEAVSKSYHQLTIDKAKASDEEKEIKLVVNRIPKTYFKKTNIIQKYIDLNNPSCREKLSEFVDDLSVFKEARIRNADGEYFVTLKGDGNLVRKEFEVSIPNEVALGLSEYQVYGTISKTRYLIYQDDYNKLEVDVYNNITANGKPLIISELEYGDDKSEIGAISFALSKLEKPFNYSVVTHNKAFKNFELAKRFNPDIRSDANIVYDIQIIEVKE